MSRIIKGSCNAEEKCLVGQEISLSIPRNAFPESSQAPELEAELILIQARREAEEIRQRAQEEGYYQGVERARRDGQLQWDQTLADLINEGQSMLAQRESLISQAEEELVRLALMIAAKVLKQEASSNSGYLASLARAALAKLVGRSRIKLFLNPIDFSRFQSGVLYLREENLSVFSDDSIGAGGCRIETECGRSDATFYHQMSEITLALLEDPGIVELAVDELGPGDPKDLYGSF
ncbi:MAG TPA: FliH/SctL family protein [Chroococcales cyanobacterium]|jgi:flagellar assembly protein FliH